MSDAFETLVIEAGGPGADALTPGGVQRALHLAAGLRADDVGLVEPLGRGRIAVEVVMGRALGLATPRALPLTEDAGAGVWLLRRSDDPPEEGILTLRATWSDDGGAPSPGALGRALSAATERAFAPEDLGPGFVGSGWIRLDAPARLQMMLTLPTRLEVDGRELTLEAVDGKKKS